MCSVNSSSWLFGFLDFQLNLDGGPFLRVAQYPGSWPINLENGETTSFEALYMEEELC